MSQKFFHKASVQVAIVTGIVAIIIVAGQIWLSHSSVRNENRELSQANRLLRDDLRKAKAEVLRLETLLTPFRTIALERYTGPEAEALRELADKIAELEMSDVDKTKKIRELESKLEKTTRLSEPPKLILEGTEVKSVQNGLETLIRFRSSKNERLAQIIINARLPAGSDAKILKLTQVPASGGSLAAFNVRQRVSPDGKAAMYQCNPSGTGDVWFTLTVSQPTRARIDLNCGAGPFEIDIGTQNQ